MISSEESQAFRGEFGQKRKTSLNSIAMVGEEKEISLKERPRIQFPSRERRNTIESGGERFRRSSFGSPPNNQLSRLKNFSLSSMMGERKNSLYIGEEKEEKKKRERKSSLGFFSMDKEQRRGSYRSYLRRGSVDCVQRHSRQRKTSLSSLGGFFARENDEDKGLVSRHGSLPTYGRSPNRSSRSVLADGSEGSLCSGAGGGAGGKSVREQRLWFSVQWPGLSVSLPEEQPLRRALSDKGGAGLTR